MLTATEEETEAVVSYMEWQAPDLRVEFVQKVYSENVLDHRHDVWDVHTDKDRWWVITNPTNLYSQEQFPNMDYAVTFHVGLCLRIPRSEKPSLGGLPIEPFTECYRGLSEASEALKHAEEASDYRAIGVRCREALLAFAHVGQLVVPWTGEGRSPLKSDFKGWVDHICDTILGGGAQERRRALFKRLLTSAWDFDAWLTHAGNSRWHDAEAAVSATENAVGLAVSMVIQHIRGVPSVCPSCGSHKLKPRRHPLDAGQSSGAWSRAMADPGVPLGHYRKHRAAVRLTCLDCMQHHDWPLEAVIERLRARGLDGEGTGVRAVVRYVRKPCGRCGGRRFEATPAFPSGRASLCPVRGQTSSLHRGH